jgi:cytochrome d ubiquinol oxidase subunit II
MSTHELITTEFLFSADTFALIFAGILALAILVYAILDGYDLGVGILIPTGNTPQELANRNTMIASIGPFWDANETWLVLAIGTLLIAFPAAHSLVFKHLYLPTAIMLAGLIARGVAFDFRSKAADAYHRHWDRVFRAGSLIAAVSQGYMLGMYVTGFQTSLGAHLFALLSGIGVAAAYCYIGAAWLVMKTEGELQQVAITWCRRAGWFSALGIISVSLVNPLLNPQVFERWFNFPAALGLMIIPVVCMALFVIVDRLLRHMPLQQDHLCWLPFVAVIMIFFCTFQGLLISFYPDLVPGKLSLFDAASAPEALQFMFYGVAIVVPVILLYTAFLYRVFAGKATKLNYY